MQMNNLFPDTLTKTNYHWEIGGLSLLYLAEKYRTPLYILDKSTLLTQAKKYLDSWKNYSHVPFKILYAVKALPILEVIRVFDKEGLSFLASTSGEIYIIRKAGVNSQKIYFHGNAKTLDEIEYALDENIYAIIVDNFDEIEKIKFLTRKRRKDINILVRIIPNIEVKTHKAITTGHMETKFGLPINDALYLIKEIKNDKYIKFKGIHAHLGSQIFKVEPYLKLAEVLSEIGIEIKRIGLNIEEMSIGGGLGIAYTPEDEPPSIENLAKEVSEKFKNSFPFPFTIICEPGRSLVGRAGITLYRIESRKILPNIKNYICVDGGMSDNPRPALYGAKYTPIFLNEKNEKRTFSIAGKHCESGDILINNTEGPWPDLGDFVAILATGAYNFSMFNWYNAVLRPAVVMVENGKDYLLVERDTPEILIRGQK